MGQISACTVTYIFMNNNMENWFEQRQIDVLKPNETVNFYPVLRASPEDDYYILCQYKNITHDENNNVVRQSWLHFKIKYSSKEGEIYTNILDKIEVIDNANSAL